MKSLAMLAPLPRVEQRLRLAKIVPILRDEGYAVTFFGWRRKAKSPLSADTLPTRTILSGGGENGSKLVRAMYPVWMLAVFLTVIRLGREVRLYCLGWETAFPALLAAYFTGAKIIFDDADRFSLILKLPWPVHRIVQALERWTSRRVALHLVPSFSRYSWVGRNMAVLRNAPSISNYEAAADMKRDGAATDLLLYVNGWIGETRGAPIFLALMNEMLARNANVRMVIAGRADSPAGQKLIEHPLVTYHGVISHREALGLYRTVDLVLTYFDPAVPINRLAESNKWGDCVFFRVPFVANSEIATATEFVAAGAAFQVPYHDVNGLVDLILGLVFDKGELKRHAANLEQFEEEFLPFDVRFREILCSHFE